jgi:hypothetical protein
MLDARSLRHRAPLRTYRKLHVEMPAHASAQDPAPTVFYDGKVILPDSPDDRRAPLPNLYPNN